MGFIAPVLIYLLIIGIVSLVAYFVIKKAIKDALKEYSKGKNC